MGTDRVFQHPFISFLTQKNFLSWDQSDVVLCYAKNNAGTIAQSCIDLGFLSEDVVAGALSDFEDLPQVTLGRIAPDISLLGNVSLEEWKRNGVVPFAESSGTLQVAIADPFDLDAKDFVRRVCPNKSIAFHIAAAKAIQVFGPEGTAQTLRSLLEKMQKNSDAANSEESATNKTLWSCLIQESLSRGFSDVHIVPQKDYCQFLYRLDGVMQKWFVCAKDFWPALISCLKVMADMDPTVQQRPQNGRFSYQSITEPVDVRLATHPSWWGEKVALRFFSTQKTALEALGFLETQQATLKRMLLKPEGLLFLAGPTGSGKTTTLQTLMAYLRDQGRLCISLEDPPEQLLPGVVQTAVGEETAFGYSGAIASVLRQDVDVIVVGEVRTSQTAQMALQAAMTGHLVLATIHAPDSHAVADRLINMGVSSVDLSMYLVGSISQRLLRRPCGVCQGKCAVGICQDCEGRGYKGRTVVADILDANEMFCHKHTGSTKPVATGRLGGLYRAALEKVSLGQTTQDEAVRVLGPDFWDFMESNGAVRCAS